MTVFDVSGLIAALPGRARVRRVLVLGDPGAEICRTLATAGHAVSCCPDRQRAVGRDHVDLGYETIADVVADDDATFDAVVAIDGWRRIRTVNGADAIATLVDWIREHATVAFVEASRRILAPDLNDLGAFEVLPLLGGFEFLAEVGAPHSPTPVVAVSDDLLLAGGGWISRDEVHRLDAGAPDAASKPVRTYAIPGDRIVKVECTSEDYFERAQVAGEAAFLTEASAEMTARLNLPRMHDVVRGRAVATLVRDAVPAEAAPSIDEQLAGVLDAAADYAAFGLFHNDVRPWNVLWGNGRARLVDYADVSASDDDVRDLPQVLALAGTLAAISTDAIRPGPAFHGDVLDLANRAGVLDRWPLAAQLTTPWLALPERRAGVRMDASMSAEEIVWSVLGATCG